MTSEVIFDVTGKGTRLAVIDEEMAKGSFWEDTRKAQAMVQERAELARTLGTLKDLVRQTEDARTLWEMATEAGDESMTAEIQETLSGAKDALEAFELKVVLSGPQDRKNVILSIHPGAGGWSGGRRCSCACICAGRSAPASRRRSSTCSRARRRASSPPPSR
jgi:peptide chain release factor 2